MTLDPKCADLAEAFLQDEPHLLTETRVYQLAQEIQDTIEGWIARENDNYEPTEAELEAYLNLGGESGDARLARQMAEARRLK